MWGTKMFTSNMSLYTRFHLVHPTFEHPKELVTNTCDGNLSTFGFSWVSSSPFLTNTTVLLYERVRRPVTILMYVWSSFRMKSWHFHQTVYSGNLMCDSHQAHMCSKVPGTFTLHAALSPSVSTHKSMWNGRRVVYHDKTSRKTLCSHS